MVVVKADGYGHGMVPVARAARAAGAEWLGVATGRRGAGPARGRGRRPGAVLAGAAGPRLRARSSRRDVDVTASSLAQLEEIVRAAREAGVDRARCS